MFCLKYVFLVTLVALATAEYNITLQEDGTFQASEYNRPKGRVINGQPARSNQFPWHVTIYTMNQPNVWSFTSGALITNQFIVTYASIVRTSRETRVFLGSNRFGQGQQVFSGQTTVHPRYTTGSNLFNIAVIRLNNPVGLNEAIRPVALPPNNLANNRFDGDYARVSGFGSAEQLRPFQNLQWAELRVTTHEFCATRYPRFAGPLFFCAVNPRQTAARPGYGDLGAPLIWRAQGQNQDILIGLVAASQPRVGNRLGVSGYINVAAHAPWIRSIVRI